MTAAVVLLLCWAQAPAVRQQPIPFSHKLHVRMGQQCADCHTMSPPGEMATFPKETRCMSCHAGKTTSPAILKLQEYAKQRKPVPWVRIYKVPEYVYFSHEAHHKKGKIACTACHGPVAERDVITVEKPTSMVACMACHDETGASNECTFCHAP